MRLLPRAREGSGDLEDLWNLFEEITAEEPGTEPQLADIDAEIRRIAHQLEEDSRNLISAWPEIREDYAGHDFTYTVRGEVINVPLTAKSLAGTEVPKVQLPLRITWPGILRYLFLENTPGAFPYTAGVFPLKRTGESPTRMFAGEGGPERTNERFHLLVRRPACQPPLHRLRLGDPLRRRIPTSGPTSRARSASQGSRSVPSRTWSGSTPASICATHDLGDHDHQRPAPMMLAMFFNAAARQQARKKLIDSGRLDGRARGRLPTAWSTARTGRPLEPLLKEGEWDEILDATMQVIRGTVQADILKEDQAQNTCIFSTEFALRMMGDIQQLFCDREVRNFYSVSISGYHIAEAGANPITQLAFTLANGFTYVETYLARGMYIDDFAPNLSFFFSNGMDPEYTVIGRVARRIWSIAIRNRYGGNDAPEAQVPHPDLGPLAARPGDRLQRHPHHSAGPAGHGRQLQLPPHQRLRRGHHHPHRGIGPPRRGHPAHQRHGVRAAQEREPPSGLAHRRVAHRPVEEAVLESSSACRNAAMCSAPWRPCTSAARSRRSACTTSA